MKCRDATFLASQALDRKLSLGERLSLEAHLFICAHCKRFGRQIGFLRKLGKEAPPDQE